MFKQVMKKMDTLEAAISFNNEVNEELKKSLENMKQAANTATMAELHDRRNNLVIFGAQNKQEIVKILGKLEVKVEEEKIEVRPIPNNKTEKPFAMPIIVSFTYEGIRDQVLKKRKIFEHMNSTNMELSGIE
ncbi:hypothetical protein HHI36_012966 [Cryptolaemus montrouzieri]|uniref:Uncharacterized protein n=1 Tax=Cryptolaemus montrouzieri TaxID=559131 RepID=A0ABD2NGU4_9CUCU